MSKKRKYSEDYVQYGFTFCTENDGTQRPKCFLCDKIMCNDNMKPSKLKEHSYAVHPNNSDLIDMLNRKELDVMVLQVCPS